jgi:membrane-bound lytic murein transglycosylase D
MHKGFLVLFRMKKPIHYLWISFFFSTTLWGLSLAQKYPSYHYVFHEFDVDESYLDNADFIYFISKEEKKLKSFYRRSLQRGKVILPTMQGMLMNDGVSDLFIYLSMVESGFLNTAVSPKKAVGLWQFMPRTAKHYNLTVCKSYDERYDTVSSTTAAIRYLNKLYKQFGKWYLAAMAYNCGEGCLQKAITKAGSKDLSLLTDERSKYLPRETREYIRKILLIAMIGESNTIQFDQVSKEDILAETIEVEVAKNTSLKKIAALLHIKVDLILKLNQKIKNGIVPKKREHYKIIIPLEKVFAFYLRYTFPQKIKKIKPYLVSHYVTLGETLESIANAYHTTIKEIQIVNNLTDDYLLLDQFLVIPVSPNIFKNTLVGH